MKLIFHGAAREVGRSCIELVTQDGSFIFDCGIKMDPEGLQYPQRMDDLTGVKAVFLSHAHLDHTGALPLLKHNDSKVKVFCTKGTARVTDILLNDSYRIDLIKHHHPAYTQLDIKALEDQMIFLPYRKQVEEFGMKIEFFNSGHIPGSCSIKVNVEGTNILYTGDINTEDTELVMPADTNYGDVDVLIVESTYGNREHEPREEVEEKFIDHIVKTTRRGGNVLIPVFGVGRAQEILLILNKYHFEVPIYLDGMARKVTDIMINNCMNLRDPAKIRTAYRSVREIRNKNMREIVMRQRGIFLTTSGMIEGGPIISYLKRFHNDKNSSLLMTGYQCEGTNGRMILEEGYAFLDGLKAKIRMEYQKYDFSAHAGMTDLHNLILKVKPKKVIINHGDEDEVLALQDWCAKNTKSKVYAPKLNDNIEL
ncbi:MBL fold metallo-hydrolase [Candidatus Woesearchaeota archaeon]|nr:MBL fold metallo-hydrolase [Candidatus Woesearchaeota archaeon]